MKTKTTVIVKLAVEGMHYFPKAYEIFPEVSFLSQRHRHIFHYTVCKKVNHDDRDVEFIMFKRDVLAYLHKQYYSPNERIHEFGPKSCEMLAREVLERFNCEWVEVWEDLENGARVEIDG